MSFMAPGPGREHDPFRLVRQGRDDVVARAREAVDRLKPPREDKVAGISRPARPDEISASAGPPALERLLRDEEVRAAARASGDTLLANRALVQVVDDLDEMLGVVECGLRAPASYKVRDAVRRIVAKSGVAALPLPEVGELLGLSPSRMAEVTASLRRNGGVTEDERVEALGHVEWLRGELRTVAETKDHSLLDRVLRVVARFAVFGAITLAAAAAGALSVDESVVREVIKTAVITLAAAALQLFVNHAFPASVGDAREAHDALVRALPDAHVLWGEPAFTGEHIAVRTRIGVLCCAARVATITLEWPDKHRYWELLDDLVRASGSESPADFAPLMRKIKSLPPPG